MLWQKSCITEVNNGNSMANELQGLQIEKAFDNEKDKSYMANGIIYQVFSNTMLHYATFILSLNLFVLNRIKKSDHFVFMVTSSPLPIGTVTEKTDSLFLTYLTNLDTSNRYSSGNMILSVTINPPFFNNGKDKSK